MTELRVRVTETARQALSEMAVSDKRQGKLLTDLLLAAKAEYERLQRDPNAVPGIGVTYVLRRAIDDKAEAQR